ncbi:glycosyltransferase family 4 protein [Haloferula sargassicola]|uniref:D-inositol-3-phosphate glycosyltransferase n=1 Tax=Haloferula sargassicola TaxID=490096 RepID=A0ABP9UKA6_9BACT
MSLLFYDDSPVFGGHEVMALAGLEAVLRATADPVIFLASEANAKLREKLAALAETHPHLHVETLPWQSSKLEALRNRLKPSRIDDLAARFRDIAPDLVIAIQGNIEHSSLALHAARKAGIPSTSYIPVPHSNHQMGAKLGRLRDLFCGPLFQLPDSFVTITDEMARMLERRGATAPVHIVYNGIDTARFQAGDPQAARRELDLPADKTLLGVVGRTEFMQKQQHLLVEAVAAEPALKQSCHLVFAGEGPDTPALRELLKSRAVAGTVLPWCDPAPLYRALDALVIPSRYEGLPLVMLEALATGTSVFGSDRDGMKDLLPAARRFDPASPTALAKVLADWLREGKPGPGQGLTDRVRHEMSLPSFAAAFSSTLLDLAGKARKSGKSDTSNVNFSVITSAES